MRVWTEYFPTGAVPPTALPAELDSPSTLVLVFSGLTATELADPVAALRGAFPQAVITGCSTAGEVLGGTVRDGGLEVCVTRFDRTPVTLAGAQIGRSADSYICGRRLAEQLAAPSLVGVMVYSDGLNVNGSQLIKGINQGLDERVVVTGGLAADADRFGRTWVIADDRPTEGIVAAVGLHGDEVVIGHGSCGGYDIFGPQRRVTRAKDNVLFELDGQPALDLYEQYLGELASGLPGTGLQFPLAISDGPHGDPLVRTMLAVHPGNRSITFAGDIPQGWTAQLMRASFDRLVDGAAQAAETATKARTAGECLAVAISCVGRRMVLKQRVEEELEAARDGLPSDARLVGFYSYGEISPLPSGRCDLHNQTMTLTMIGERSA
ncbi:MAG TPA: FIST N-terminal domain-containing protein [Kineosporiaceae bacterium]|nr:FIST N-terminal domain-containing protein [Kineosporiaceae bacterium]